MPGVGMSRAKAVFEMEWVMRGREKCIVLPAYV